MAKDDLEDYVTKRGKRERDFPDLVAAAEERQALARKLAAKREAAELSQTQVAAKMKTSASVVSRIEGGADVRFSTLQKYASALNLELTVALSHTHRRARR